MPAFRDLTGQKFGRWTVWERAPNNKYGQAFWHCVCGCEDGTKKVIPGAALTFGKTRSCGCLRLQKVIERNQKRKIAAAARVLGKCCVDGCSKQEQRGRRGYCGEHYHRLIRFGRIHPKTKKEFYTIKGGYLRESTGKRRHGKKELLHRLIAERALGKPLPKGAHVHHVGDTSDNHNIVICPDISYHLLIHVRTRAFEACGNANYRKCTYCEAYDDPVGMRERKGSGSWHHVRCRTAIERLRSYRLGKRSPTGIVGFVYETLRAPERRPSSETASETDHMALTVNSLRAAGLVQSVVTGKWIHRNERRAFFKRVGDAMDQMPVRRSGITKAAVEAVVNEGADAYSRSLRQSMKGLPVETRSV
jgi:hypothetical protein